MVFYIQIFVKKAEAKCQLKLYKIINKKQERQGYIMNMLENLKLEELVDAAKLNRLINEKVRGKKEEKKKTNVLLWILAVIGVMAATAAVVYAVYRYFKPDYLDDFDDDFEDDFDNMEDDDDDFFEDEGED